MTDIVERLAKAHSGLDSLSLSLLCREAKDEIIRWRAAVVEFEIGYRVGVLHDDPGYQAAYFAGRDYRILPRGRFA
jgi:hypothetical protein